MHMFIRADQDSHIYSTNTPYDFTCNLPRPISNSAGSVRLCVKEITVVKHRLAEGIFLLTIDSVHPSPCFGSEHPVVTCFTLDSQRVRAGQTSCIERVEIGSTPNYFKVLHSSVTRLRIQLKKESLSERALALTDAELIKQIYIVIHFKL